VKGPFTLASAAVVLLAAGAGGFLSYRLLTPQPTITPAPPRAPAEEEPPSVVELPPPPPQRAVAQVLPEVAMPDLSGKTRKLSEWKGHLLAVNFWAAWCEPCQREIPLLKKVRSEHAADGFEVVGIAVDLQAAVAKYARQARIDYPVLVGERNGLAAITALGMDTVFPFTVFADRQGRIITLKRGELQPDEAELILERMKDLDAGRLTLEATREKIRDGMQALAAARASH
jgi:thiol-disulfide isomerase/thioredoxin